MDKENIIKELLSVQGIDRKIALKLLNAGIRTIIDLQSQNPQNLSEKIGFNLKTVENWIKSAVEIIKYRELTKNEESILRLSDFLKIPYEDAKVLRNVGVFNIEDLANEDPKQLSDDAGFDVDIVKLWIKKAKKEYKIKSPT